MLYDISCFHLSVTLVWNLCEASETAIKIFNSQNIVHLLLSYINVEKYGIDVVACVLQCIYSISENNIPAITAIKVILQALSIMYFDKINPDLTWHQYTMHLIYFYRKEVLKTFLVNSSNQIPLVMKVSTLKTKVTMHWPLNFIFVFWLAESQ